MGFKNGLAGRHRVIPEKNAPWLGLRHKMKVLIALACVFTVGRLVWVFENGFACWGRWAGCDEHVSSFMRNAPYFFNFLIKLAALLAVSFTVSSSTYVLIQVHFAQTFLLSPFQTKHEISLTLVDVSFACCCTENPCTWNSPGTSGRQAHFRLQKRRRVQKWGGGLSNQRKTKHSSSSS